MYVDLAMVETGDGGDVVLSGNDLVTVSGIEGQPYLCMFSGTGWWGNTLLLNDNPDTIYMSKTEIAMREYPLTSSGRLKIEAAIIDDLKPIAKNNPGVVVEVQTAIAGPDRLRVDIYLRNAVDLGLWNIPPAVEQYVRQKSGIGYWIIEFNFIVS